MQFYYMKCNCICSNPECSTKSFIPPYLEKEDFYSQGYCQECESWNLESEINECEHCEECREAFQKEMQEAAKEIQVKPLQSCPSCENILDTKCEC